MGFDCALNHAFDFTYSADFSNGLKEHEFDNVFVGIYNGAIKPNSNEVDSFKWMDSTKLKVDMQKHPEKYTVWFKMALDKVLDFHKGQIAK
jgi:isopentenyl-diphosphate delta-isomerase